MPDISRSSVDLPAPLCPTSATRSPWRSDRVMSRSASMIGTLESVPIRPPARPSTAFFSERVLASKIGKSTRGVVDVDAGFSAQLPHTQYATRER